MASHANGDTAVDRRVVFSTVWICTVFNYVCADLFSLIANPALRELGAGLTEGALLGWAVIMQTAIAMVLLSRVLPSRANRWANIAAGVVHTGIVAWSLSAGMLRPYYVFFAAVEIGCTVFVVGYAWTWKVQPVGRPALE